MLVRILNRRRLLVLGLGAFASSIAGLLRQRGRSEAATASVEIHFPDGYTIDQYEYDVPTWAKHGELRKFMRGFIQGRHLIDFEKSTSSQGVAYKFVFDSNAALESFIRGVREQKLVDFESRSNRGLKSVIIANGVRLEC